MPNRKIIAGWSAAVLVTVMLVVVVASRALSCRESPPGLRQDATGLGWLAACGDADVAQVLDRSVIQVAGGEFVMGSDTGRSDERPARLVYLDTFEIDRYEVTNLQYRRFLQASHGVPPPYWSGSQYPAGQALYPVVGVSWDDADAYCRSAGKRLPTEAEWEKACRGSDGRTWPWGDSWDPRRANVDRFTSAAPLATPANLELGPWDVAWRLLRVTPVAPGTPSLAPVGSYPVDSSPYGVMDMAGNASEWVADWYNWADYSSLPSRNPLNSQPPWNHCLRGGTWHDPTGNAAWVQIMTRCSARSSSHETQDPRVGFRCAHMAAASPR